MAYVPTYDEIPDPKPSASSVGGYVPTYDEIPDPKAPIHHGLAAQAAAVPLAALSGIAEGTRQLANLGAAGVNYVARELGGKDILPHLPKASFTHALRLPQDRPIEAIGETIPALAGADISAPLTGLEKGAEAVPFLTRGMATQAAGGGLYGAGQAVEQRKPVGVGTAIGSGIGLVGGAAGEGLSALGKPLGRFISREIFSPLAEKAGKLIAADTPAEDPLSAIGTRLNAAREKAKLWTPELEEASKAADKGGKFDNAHYTEVATNILKDLKDQENEDPDFYSPIVSAVQNKLDMTPTSYKSAVAQRSALNRMPQTWELTNKPVSNMLKGISTKLKSGLDEQIERNSGKNPAAQDFAAKWLEHRKNYQFLKSFEQTPIALRNETALLKYSKPQAESLAGDEPSDSTLQHFLPVGKNKDTFKMEHLGRLIGNPELARKALKEEYLRDAYDPPNDQINPIKLLAKYKSLSSKQQDYFFSPEEQTLLNSASKAKGNARTNALRHIGSRYGTPIGLGAVAGGLIGEHEGEGWGKGALLGAALGAGAGLIPKAFISPGGAAIAHQLTQEGFSPRALSYPLSSIGLALNQ